MRVIRNSHPRFLATLLFARVKTVPVDMDASFKALIEECWDAEQTMRPSFDVIIFRLEAILQAKNAALADKAKEDDLRRLCRELNEQLWQFDAGVASALVREDATTTARDPTLNEILSSETGATCVKTLGWMMFGGQREDGSKLRPEPLLDEDITLAADASHVLLKARFAAIAPEKVARWKTRDKREFDALRAALAAAESEVESYGRFRAKREPEAL